MLDFKKNKKRILVGVGGVLFILFILIFVYPGMGAKQVEVVEKTNTDSLPMMVTDDVIMNISDSGLIRYKMIAKTWMVYDQANNSHWFFPDKFYVEQFDTLFNVVATIEADTAWNFTQKKLWRLRGNVKVQNREGDKYTSEELYWDERRRRIYSDQYVEIHQPGKMTLKVLEGFEANQEMTEYTFKTLENTDIYLDESNEKEDNN